ncbi:MAG TPA: hypothetical protein VFR03_13410 [Thermoanaerobaculia bacterium]|nr:hypothetical protein [Thermoanaerobaculia bacterium]
MLTSASWLEVLTPRLIEPLFTFEAVERLRRLAVALPGECQGILETRLTPGAAPVDLSLRLRTADEARALAARFPLIQELLSRWAEGSLAPARSVWLELDLDREPAADRPAPIVCAKLPQETDPRWLIGTLLPALQSRPLPAGQRARILSCLDSLPPQASLLYVFSLQARGSQAVRLEIFGLEPAGISGYLRSVAPDAVPAAEAALPLFEGVERLHLSFDVADDEILPRIGIEGSFPRQPPREPRWGAFFERLVRRGLCSPGKRDAALAWPGYDTFWTAPERWPVAALGPGGICLRTLSHLKAVCAPDREPEAKAYLTFGPPDLSNGGATASSVASRSDSST